MRITLPGYDSASYPLRDCFGNAVRFGMWLTDHGFDPLNVWVVHGLIHVVGVPLAHAWVAVGSVLGRTTARMRTSEARHLIFDPTFDIETTTRAWRSNKLFHHDRIPGTRTRFRLAVEQRRYNIMLAIRMMVSTNVMGPWTEEEFRAVTAAELEEETE